MADNLNYYWQKRNEADQKSREYEKLQEDIANGLKHNQNKEKEEQQKKELARSSSNVGYLQAKLSESQKEVEYYKNLLTKPMHEIADVNGNFQETYHQQQTILGEWMVSQRAFKELAIQLGIEAGRTKEDIVAEGMANKEKVLNNQTEHGNDFNQNEWQLYYAPRIKAKQGIK